MQLVQRINTPLTLHNLTELTKIQKAIVATLFYPWLAQYLSRIQNTWDTWKHAPNAIERSTHIPLLQVQDDMPFLHFHKYNRNLRQDGTNSCSRFIIIPILCLFIPLFKYTQTVIISCILLWILHVGLNVRLYKNYAT